MPRAQSADGAIHEFPDGTDPSVIDRVMKDYATRGQPHATANLSTAPDSASSVLRNYLSESWGALKGAVPEVAQGAKDIGGAIAGGDPHPALNRVGDILQFLTGGLTSPLGAEGRIVDPATKIGEARNLAREIKAPVKIERAEQQAAKPPAASLPFMQHPMDILPVMEAVARGDWKWLALSFGRKGAEELMGWARNPNRRAEDLRKFLDARRQARVEEMQKFVDEHGGAGLDELKRMIEVTKETNQ
jgi:hypothetical protein